MGRREAGEQHDRITRELNQERAAALMRISRTLERSIEELRTAREQLARLHGPDRERQLRVCRELRARALEYRWYLEVQREALGLRHHHRLDEFYAVPSLDTL